MNQQSLLIRCPTCHIGSLTKGELDCTCSNCGVRFPIADGIVLLEAVGDTDLHMSEGELINDHLLREQRILGKEYVKSDVDYSAYLFAWESMDLHVHWLQPYFRGAVVADLGCGQIPAMKLLPDTIQAYYGFDLSHEGLKIADEWFKGQFPLVLVQNGVMSVPLPDNSVDIVICAEVIEHLDDPKALLREIHRILKPGGYLSLSTPCVSVYLYPYMILRLLRRPGYIRTWWRQLRSHLYWNEVLDLHPSLQPGVLRGWVSEAGFQTRSHETRLWYYYTLLKPEWRFFRLLENLRIPGMGRLFYNYLRMTERLLAAKIPILRWRGTRQFVLARKES